MSTLLVVVDDDRRVYLELLKEGFSGATVLNSITK